MISIADYNFLQFPTSPEGLWISVVYIPLVSSSTHWSVLPYNISKSFCPWINFCNSYNTYCIVWLLTGVFCCMGWQASIRRTVFPKSSPCSITHLSSDLKLVIICHLCESQWNQNLFAFLWKCTWYFTTASIRKRDFSQFWVKSLYLDLFITFPSY